MTNNENEALRERIFGIIPVSHIGYFSLLKLLDIEASDTVETAAISLGDRSVLRINPQFVDTYCRRDESFTMLILHEIMHVLMGHTRMYNVADKADNIALDAVINAHLCRLFPMPEYTSFFRTLYQDNRLPEALLRPPDGWSAGKPRWKLTGEACAVHKALYTDESVTVAELLELVKKQIKDGNSVLLLGNHESKSGNPPPLIMQNLQEIISQWPKEQTSIGRDDGGDTSTSNLTTDSTEKQVIAILRKALITQFNRARNDVSMRRKIHFGTTSGIVPWRTTEDRKGIVAEGLTGVSPLLWHGSLRHTTMQEMTPPTLYLDVSGSMLGNLSTLYKAFELLRSFMNQQVVLFSTDTYEMDFHRVFIKGTIVSTGGTSIHCVTNHIIRNNIRHAVIVTDGFVGDVPSNVQSKMKQVSVSAVITEDGDSQFAKQMGARLFVLPHMINGGYDEI